MEAHNIIMTKKLETFLRDVTVIPSVNLDSDHRFMVPDVKKSIKIQ
jgi:hypothetical protein